MTARQRRAAWIAVFLGACLLALMVDATLGRFSAPERWEYSSIAGNVVEGRGWYYDYLGARYRFYGPPLYPALLVLATWNGPQGEIAMLVLQAMALAATALVVGAVAHHVAGGTAALVAGVLVATHPGALVYAAKLHSQTLDTLLIAIAFLLTLRVGVDSQPVVMFGSGIVAGLAVLSRGPVAPFFVAWAVWFLVRERRRSARAVRAILLVTLGGIVAILPLVAVGYVTYGRLVPLRTDTGVNLWYGNHPGASGTSYTNEPTPRPVITTMPPDLSAAIAGRDELAQNATFIGAALRFMREHPGDALALYLRKVGYFWWFSPHAGLLYPSRWVTVYSVYYALVLCGVAVGLVGALRSAHPLTRRAAELLLLLAITMSATQAIFYVEGRHRWLIEPLLLAVAAASLPFARLRTDDARTTSAARMETKGRS